MLVALMIYLYVVQHRQDPGHQPNLPYGWRCIIDNVPIWLSKERRWENWDQQGMSELKNRATEEWNRQNPTKEIGPLSSITDHIDFFTPPALRTWRLKRTAHCTKHGNGTVKRQEKTDLAFPADRQRGSSIQEIVYALVNDRFLESANDTGGQVLQLPWARKFKQCRICLLPRMQVKIQYCAGSGSALHRAISRCPLPRTRVPAQNPRRTGFISTPKGKTKEGEARTTAC